MSAVPRLSRAGWVSPQPERRVVEASSVAADTQRMAEEEARVEAGIRTARTTENTT